MNCQPLWLSSENLSNQELEINVANAMQRNLIGVFVEASTRHSRRVCVAPLSSSEALIHGR